ncbi:MAG: Tol-Pal system beta propeller repeat protein TolB [Deltaproteobacteria bacterium]|nr:Tol-Pal system beta propeller repeat protein TolB [Deltaproteobacteria bacterium]
MKRFKYGLISRILKTTRIARAVPLLLAIMSVHFLSPSTGEGKLFIDINSPSIQRINIAIPDFVNLSSGREHGELSRVLRSVLSSDLGLSGYFNSMPREAFLEENAESLSPKEIRFKDWSVIGAELLVKAGYNTIGNNIELEVRLFDVFWGRQLLARRFLGKISRHRYLMHRVSSAIIKLLTGQDGISLTKVAFVSNATGHKEIYVSDYDGQNVRMITSNNSINLSPRWSPEGDKLIFVSYKDGGPMLYLKDFKSGDVKRVSQRKGLNIGAAWAPDGKRLALTLSHKNDPDIYLIDLEGRILRQVTDHWGIDVSPTFSPDGKKIAFVSNRSGSPQIYVKDLTTGSERRITFQGNYNTSPSWSALNRIAFSGMSDGSFDIFTIDPENGKQKNLTRGAGSNEDPCWSPDGRYILFSSNRDRRYRLYIMNGNGLDQTRITDLKGDQTAPSWAPY